MDRKTSTTLKKFLFYFGHPAQYLFLRGAMKNLLNQGHSVTILIKTKDVLEQLVISDGFAYQNILQVQRGNSRISIFLSLLKRLRNIVKIILKDRPDVMVGTDATVALIGYLFSISRITITEDDYEVIKNLARLTYPFTETILCPAVCWVGNHNKKKVGYAGYMKLGYLHPEVFMPNHKILNKYNLQEGYVLIRLAKLTAHHDFGVKGISIEHLNEIIKKCKEKGLRVYISSEAELADIYKIYQTHFEPNDMHHVMSFAALLISDSQSMSVEAAMLGVPSIRFSDFVGKISVLEELEYKYKLTFGVMPSNPQKLFNKIDDLLEEKSLKELFKERRKKMLSEKINVTSFLTWFLLSYPESKITMQENPSFQSRFLSETILNS
jgi:predicted glycosyltransferase